MEILKWLQEATEKNASDIFIGVGRKVSFKIDGIIEPRSDEPSRAEYVNKMISELYGMAGRDFSHFEADGDDEFSVAVPGLARFRVCAYRQRNTNASVIRVVRFGIPDYETLNIPDGIMEIASAKSGLVLVTGPAGSGKSTTIACILDNINKTRNCHVITLEDPIEYLHRDNKSLFSQREISTDTSSYSSALRACLRKAPDIIHIGEMRDLETIGIALSAAETGHLVISTLHTAGAVSTLDRIVDVFPPNQQRQIQVQLSMVLRTVVSQHLLAGKDGGLVPAYEIMRVNKAIGNMIREAKMHQIDSIIQTSGSEGMISMDSYIFKLYEEGKITDKTAIESALNPEQIAHRIEGKY